MSDMADVLVQHHVSHADWDEREVAVLCHCGVETVGEDNGEEAYAQEEALYAKHVAAALSAAGFGPVREAWAGAIQEAAAVGWDAAVAAMKYEDGTPVDLAENVNPYRT